MATQMVGPTMNVKYNIFFIITPVKLPFGHPNVTIH